MLRVPKTTLKFNDLLGGLTELRKAVILMVTVYYPERTEIKISKGHRHRGRVLAKPGVELPWTVGTVPHSPAMMRHKGVRLIDIQSDLRR